MTEEQIFYICWNFDVETRHLLADKYMLGIHDDFVQYIFFYL